VRVLSRSRTEATHDKADDPVDRPIYNGIAQKRYRNRLGPVSDRAYEQKDVEGLSRLAATNNPPPYRPIPGIRVPCPAMMSNPPTRAKKIPTSAPILRGVKFMRLIVKAPRLVPGAPLGSRVESLYLP
jgi:hypothetical protein